MRLYKIEVRTGLWCETLVKSILKVCDSPETAEAAIKEQMIQQFGNYSKNLKVIVKEVKTVSGYKITIESK